MSSTLFTDITKYYTFDDHDSWFWVVEILYCTHFSSKKYNIGYTNYKIENIQLQQPSGVIAFFLNPFGLRNYVPVKCYARVYEKILFLITHFMIDIFPNKTQGLLLKRF